MSVRAVLVTLLFALVLSDGPVQAGGPFREVSFSMTDMVWHRKPSVCKVVSYSGQQGSESRSIGTGVHLGNGYVLTATHVLRDHRNARVHFDNGETREMKHYWYSKDNDQSVIMLDKVPNVPSAQLAHSEPAVGSRCYLMGFDQGSRLRLYEGPYGGSRYDSGHGMEVFTVSVQGNSGGPVFNHQGELIGNLWGSDFQSATSGVSHASTVAFFGRVAEQFPPFGSQGWSYSGAPPGWGSQGGQVCPPQSSGNIYLNPQQPQPQPQPQPPQPLQPPVPVTPQVPVQDQAQCPCQNGAAPNGCDCDLDKDAIQKIIDDAISKLPKPVDPLPPRSDQSIKNLIEQVLQGKNYVTKDELQQFADGLLLMIENNKSEPYQPPTDEELAKKIQPHLDPIYPMWIDEQDEVIDSIPGGVRLGEPMPLRIEVILRRAQQRAQNAGTESR